MRTSLARVRLVLPLLAVLLSPSAVLAGPPVLWHPLEIGAEPSLPWTSSPRWWQGQHGYDLRRLAEHTDTLLKGPRPLVARMETLRRAAVYASQDAATARALFARFAARAEASDKTTLFDFIYLRAVLQAIAHLDGEPQFQSRARAVANIPGLFSEDDGAARIAALWPDDPAAAFACALITAVTSRDAYRHYRALAQRGVERDSLVARNIAHLH